MDENWQQLATYVARKQGSDEAFAAIVERHIGLVYSAALRQVNDRSIAEEVTQSVFVLLSQKAPRLKPTGSLAAWLYHAASLKAKESLRSELARRKRERKAHDMATTTSSSDDEDTLDWDRVAPLLDSAMGDLPDGDREAVLLRFFQNQPLREVGASLGVSEDAARKRVSRAVEKLRGWFAKRGVAFSAAALAGALSTKTVEAVPAHLAASTLQAVAAETATATATASTTTLLTTMASTKSIAIAAALVGAAIPISLGYLETPDDAPLAPEVPEVVADPLAIPEPADSELVAEWKRLRSQFGPDAGSMPELYSAVKEYKDSFRRRAFRGALIAEWVSLDGNAALAYLKEHDRGMLGQLFGDWLTTDPEAAIAALNAGGKDLERQIQDNLKRIAKIAPEALPSLAVHVGRKRPWDLHVQNAFSEYARENFEAARALAESMEGDDGSEAMAGIMHVWAERDGMAAFEWVKEIEDQKQRDRLMQALLVGWAKSDPKAALERIDLAPPGGGSMSVGYTTAAQIVRAAAEKDFDVVLEWLPERGASSDPRGNGIDGLKGELSKRFMADVAGTLDFITGHPAEEPLKYILGNILMNEGFAKRDEVWEWAKVQDESEYASNLRMRLLRTAAWKSPDVALEWLKEMPEGANTSQLSNLAQALINHGHDIQRLDGLLERLPEDSSFRKRVLLAGFGRLDESVDAGAWIERLDQLDHEQRPLAVQSLARGWAAQDPQATIAWAEELPPDQKNVAVRGLVEGWASGDSYEASEWISTLEEGEIRDLAVVGLVSVIADEDPGAGAKWAATVTSDDHRHSAVTSLIHRVMAKDPETAQRILDDAVVTDDQRGGLQKAIDQRKNR